jgi:hypothetical protein
MMLGIFVPSVALALQGSLTVSADQIDKRKDQPIRRI